MTTLDNLYLFLTCHQCLIPVAKETIPKTSIGKIQRSQLKQRLEAGEFDDILQNIEIFSSNNPKTESLQVQQLRAYIVPNGDSIPVTKLQEIEVKDRFGISTTCEFIQVKELPNLSNKQPVAPRNAVERQITKIWQEVLDNPSIGIYDNFFELGGHSC